MKSIIVLIVCLLTKAYLFGYSGEELLQKITVKYSKMESIQFQTKYDLYKGHKSNEIISSYEGFIYRKDNELYQKIDKTEFVYGKDFFLKISHKEHVLVLDSEQKTMTSDIDLSQFKNDVREVKVKEFESSYKLVIYYKSYSQVPFSCVTMLIDRDSELITQMDFYYTNPTDFSKETLKRELDLAHLRVTFFNIKINPARPNDILDWSTYLGKKNSYIIPVKNCVGYELIDNRIN